MMFQTQLKRARLTYAILMSGTTCVIMSAVSTEILSPNGTFWRHWPTVLGIDLCIAIPVAILLAPYVRKLCGYLYPDVEK